MRLTNLTLAGDLRLAGLVALTLAGLAGCPKNEFIPRSRWSPSPPATPRSPRVRRSSSGGRPPTRSRPRSASATPRSSSVPGGRRPTAASRPTLTSGGEYVLTAKGAGDDTKTGTVTVAVSGAPTIAGFTATPRRLPSARPRPWAGQSAGPPPWRSAPGQGLVFRSDDPADLGQGSRTVTVFAAPPTPSRPATRRAGRWPRPRWPSSVRRPSPCRAPGAVISGGDEVTLSWLPPRAPPTSR